MSLTTFFVVDEIWLLFKAKLLFRRAESVDALTRRVEPWEAVINFPFKLTCNTHSDTQTALEHHSENAHTPQHGGWISRLRLHLLHQLH